MPSDINFFKKYVFSIYIAHSDLGEIGRAELKFGNGSWAHVIRIDQGRPE